LGVSEHRVTRLVASTEVGKEVKLRMLGAGETGRIVMLEMMKMTKRI
jgi:hypothetical protein